MKETNTKLIPDQATIVVFVLMVILGGGNALAIHFSSLELPPYWGAALRFGPSALIFWVLMIIRRMPLPRGKALLGAVIYGVLSVGVFYALLYYALIEVQVGLATVVLAMGPLFTFFFAIGHKQEQFKLRGLFGGLIALIGIYLTIFGDFDGRAPALSLLAVLGASLVISEASVLYKQFPKNDPLVTNAITVSVGAVFLIVLSLAAGESWALPARSETWLALAFSIPVGTVFLFFLYLFVLDRWTASATSYSFLLFPIASVLLSAWLTEEMITPMFLLGGTLVLLGVWVGALRKD